MVIHAHRFPHPFFTTMTPMHCANVLDKFHSSWACNRQKAGFKIILVLIFLLCIYFICKVLCYKYITEQYNQDFSLVRQPVDEVHHLEQQLAVVPLDCSTCDLGIMVHETVLQLLQVPVRVALQLSTAAVQELWSWSLSHSWLAG